jgi:integrase
MVGITLCPSTTSALEPIAETLAVVLLGGDAGLRRGEIMALKWADVDFARFMLAQVLWPEPSQRVRARALAVEAARSSSRLACARAIASTTSIPGSKSPPVGRRPSQNRLARREAITPPPRTRAAPSGR